MDFSFPIALKPPTKFPLFSPPPPSPSPPHLHRPSEIRFSRWNNANADKFNRQERTQKDLEDQIRIQKRFDSALTIAHNYNPAPPHLTTKSTGTPSSPSSPSVPGKFSKYSKPPHPAFKTLITKSPKIDPNPNPNPNPETPNFKIDENGVSYELPEAPFLYRYSYTETPKVRPVKLREPLVSPFGPESMPKPWLGRKPLPPSKKRLPEFDSFRLPPPHKKGVKSVQSPGPYLPGSGPKYVKSREEVLGEPLTKEEVLELVNSCKKSDRQLNMGRDGLTHNMLDNIHAHWKRRRVCKIKCKGVCTVDMENVSQQLEERTGGEIIYSRGGVVYLFRGRNYNYKYRPRFPLMLWKPVSPVYPRLIKKIPEGLTIEEAIEMRKKGRDLTPICKLAKNGVYSNLVKDIKEAFEACELVRINCQGLNPSDYRKIGAKLKDLVPCVLISFEYEHILIWRGRDWRSSFTEDKESPKGLEEEVQEDNVASGQLGSPSSVLPLSITHSNSDIDTSSSLTHGSGEIEGIGDSAEVGVTELVSGVIDFSGVDSHETLNKESIGESTSFPLHAGGSGSHSEEFDGSPKSETVSDGTAKPELSLGKTDPDGSILTSSSAIPQPHNQLSNVIKSEELMKLSSTSGVLLLREQAVDSGLAFVLDDDSLDADIVFKKAASFGKTAPTGPVFRHRPRKSAVQEMKEHERDDSQVKKAPAVVGTEMAVSGKRVERKTSRTSKKMKDSKVDYLNVVPQGKLAIDELAKLLA